MNTTAVLAEFVVVGAVGLLIVHLLFPNISSALLPQLGTSDAIVLLMVIAVSYIIGFLVNVLAEFALNQGYRLVESRWKRKQGSGAVAMDAIRYYLYASAPDQVIHRMEYHRALLRLSRSLTLLSTILIVPALVQRDWYMFGCLTLLALSSLLAFYRRVIWFSKTCYLSWLSLRHSEKEDSRKDVYVKSTISETQAAGHLESTPPLRLITFAGGTGFRDINIALAGSRYEIVRVVPVWDNGGSSKQLRRSLQVMPIGDIRHALMTMAHGEERVSSVVKLFNARLPEDGNDVELRRELSRFTGGSHPMIENVDPNLREVIVNYLRTFEDKLPEGLDLRYGSIGNFVLVGAYLSHGENINTAIYVFRQLCSIKGGVYPVSLRNDLHVGVELENGKVVTGQERVTNLDRTEHRSRIMNTFFTNNLNDSKPADPLKVSANPLVLESMRSADVVIFGPGSFFTSVLPHIMIEGVADELASLDVPKVLIGNMLEHVEGYDYTSVELAKLFLTTCNNAASVERAPNKYLTHFLINDPSNTARQSLLGTRYLQIGERLDKLVDSRIQCLQKDYEDFWRRGFHNASMVASFLPRLKQ